MVDQQTDQVRRVCAFFEPENGAERWEQLVHFAERRIRRGAWCVKRADGSMPNGSLAQDVVDSVITSVLLAPGAKGHRRLPDNVDVGVGLQQIIWSCINHALFSAENKARADLPTQEDGTDYEGSVPFWSPCEHDISDDDRSAAWARVDEFLGIVKKRDREVYDMLVLLREEGIEKPAEIAKRLGMAVSKVYLARKRLGVLLRRHGMREKSK